jgi:predicted ester cyclase
MNLPQVYRAYIAAINAQDWESVKPFVNDPVVHNERSMSKEEYCHLMISFFSSCPDAVFNIDKLIVDEHEKSVACLIMLEGTPVKELFGQNADGSTKVRFAEHVFYDFTGGKIAQVKSLVDCEGARRQLGG